MTKADALKRRYIAFELRDSGSISGSSEETIKRAIYDEALKFFGEFGLSEAALKLVSYNPARHTGVLRCERGYLDKVLGFLALVSSLGGSSARLVSLKSSGSIKSLAEFCGPSKIKTPGSNVPDQVPGRLRSIR